MPASSEPFESTQSPGTADLRGKMGRQADKAAEAASEVSSTLSGTKPGSVKQKVALLSVGIQLFRRYPVLTLLIAGAALVVYSMRHRPG
jgi:hypothetical protein